MYSAFEVAKYIIWYCTKENHIVSNLKLQKILYFVQAEFLVARNTPCFNEKIEAWTFGPVVPDVYYKYRAFGNAHIPCVDMTDSYNITHEDRLLINGIVDACAPYTAPQLTEITRNQSPWLKAYHTNKSCIISETSIHEFFKKEESDL